MTNEEKILAILEKHGEMLAEMKAAQDKMKASQDKMQTSQDEMRGDISTMQETLTRVAVTQEGVVLPRLQLALEGHSELNRKLDALAPKERVEVLEDRVITLETAMKSMAKRLSALEKAQ